MATLSNGNLAELRREITRGMNTVGFDKPTINAALQAVEDVFEGIRAKISNDINTATSPEALATPVKKALVKAWLRQKVGRE